MHLPFEIDGADLALSVVALCLLLYLGHRIKQRRLARMNRNRDAEIQSGGDALDDGFYCIMLKDGTTRSGFITRGEHGVSSASTASFKFSQTR